MEFSIKNNMEKLIFILFLINISSGEYIPPGPRYKCPQRREDVRLIHPCICNEGTDAGLFVTCENSGLATLSVGLGNLASLDIPIEQLTLKECKIGKLYGPLLHNLKLRILKIIDTPVKTIEEHFFFGVNRTLQNFQLLNSTLETFPKLAFNILGNLTYLRIDGHTMESFDKDIFANSYMQGKLERLHIINGELKELEIESFQPLKKVKTVDIHGNKISVLKKNQFKGLRDVEVLDISYNNITKLDSSHIADLTKLSWCNVSHNHLTEITRGMFARNAVLRVLHMNHNHIKRLDTNSFRGMRFMRRLYLSDNEISDVGRGTFGSITRIGSIDLARNKIKKIDYQMFHQLNFVEVIDIAENQITEIQKLAFKDIYLATINISHNQISKIETGAFENCANITLLDLSHNNLTDIAPKAFDSTTYASELQLSYNQFTELTQIPLYNMSGIKVLNVSHNLIHTIPKNSFPKLYELHTIDLSHNQLKEIFNSVFQVLFSLRFINMSHNTLEQIKPTSFGTLPTLLELDLSHNLLTDVARSSFAKLASCSRLDLSHNYLEKITIMPISLGDLNLSHNNISVIPDNVWPTMNALLFLDLSNNPLGPDGLTEGSFKNLLTLRSLTLTETKLERPPWESLNALSSLQYLKLNKNNLTTLNKGAFGKLPIVFDLDLTDNQISNISVKAFDGLLQLLSLSLRNNLITYIPNGAFHGLVSLRTLDLSQNQLEKLDNKTHGLLDDCLSLERVNLSSNKISFISRKMFPSDPYIPYKLKEIDLSYNSMPVLTYDIVFGAKKVESLNLSHNILNDIRKNVIGNLTSLKYLDLSHNGLEDITSDKDVFRLPPNITSINLSNNQFTVIPLNELSNSSTLAMLDLSSNFLDILDEKLVRKIKSNGLVVDFSGNQLQCDCFSRPLKHYINHLPKSQLTPDFAYYNLTCSSPANVQGVNFLEIDDDRLNCGETVEIRRILDSMEKTVAREFEVEPDIIFREVLFYRESISISWFVQSNKDIADFRIVIRNNKNDILYSKDIPYNQRQHSIKIPKNEQLNSAIANKDTSLELCILAGNSNAFIGNWFASQCKPLPSDFSELKKEVTQLRTYNFNRRGYTRSSSSKLYYNLIVPLILFLSVKFST